MHTTTVPCPHLLDDGAPCEADVTVTLAFDPGEKATRWEPGVPESFYPVTVAGKCAAGHVLTTDELAEAERASEDAADAYQPDVPDPADYCGV